MKCEIEISRDIFPGFYETDFSPERIERYDDNNNLEEFTDDQCDEYKDRICQTIADLVRVNLDYHVTKWVLDSPKWYNYRNDILVLEIEIDIQEILWRFFTHEEYMEMIEYINFSEYNVDAYHLCLLEELITFELYKYEDAILSEIY